MQAVLATMRVQQRKHSDGPSIGSSVGRRTRRINGIGSPANLVGMISPCFGPSNDACTLPFLVPSNLFAVTTLRHMATMLNTISRDAAMANEADRLAKEVEQTLCAYAIASTPQGTVSVI
jgi:meiotically up-regulated gene 157 (Mug157) protein